MADNILLRAVFQGNNEPTLSKLVDLIRGKGFIVRNTIEQPHGPYTRFETTMDIEELDLAISEADASSVIIEKEVIE